MDLTLYYEVYKCGINKKAIPEYIKYFEPYYLPYTIKDHVRRAGFKTES